MAKQEIPAGLGQLYFTTADDKELKNLRPVGLCKTTLNVSPDEKSEIHWADNKSYELTGTLHLDNRQARKLRKLLSDGRMPRKEKKRRKNRVRRDPKLLTRIAIALWTNDYYGFMMAAGKMFPERFKRVECDNPFLILKYNEHKVCRVLVRRIKENQKKIIRQNWDIVKEMKRKALCMMQEEFKYRREHPVFRHVDDVEIK